MTFKKTLVRGKRYYPTCDGYVRIKCPDHPYAERRTGYVLLHRVKVENSLGRYLSPDELVHHKNEDPSDNRLCNLKVTDRVSHSEHHHPPIKRPPKGELKKMLASYSIPKVAIYYDAAITTVRKWIKKYGLTVPKAGTWKTKKRVPKELLIELLSNNSVPATAKKLGIGAGLVRKWMKYHEVNGRSQERERTVRRRPTRKELEKSVWDAPLTSLAKRWGIASNTLGRWCDDYKIERPPRGYWRRTDF